MRAVYRHVNYTIIQDPVGERTWRATCVSGEEKDCGADSGELGSEKAAVMWMATHRATTGHMRFKRYYTDYALAQT